MSLPADFEKRYLERLGLDSEGNYPPTAKTLAQLQEAHVRTVPFETLDIVDDVPLSLDPCHLFDKIVVRRRGGFCFELNGLFALLLEHLGYRVERLAGWVPSCKDPFDHILLRVTVPDTSEPWLVDVGFRNGALLPLFFQTGVRQQDPKAGYVLEEAAVDDPGEGELWLKRKIKGASDWQPLYRFSLKPHAMEDFQPRMQEFATQDWSPFRKRPSCSLETRQGEIYLNDKKLVSLVEGHLVERAVADREDFVRALETEFGVLYTCV